MYTAPVHVNQLRGVLIHWRRDKMADISQTTISAKTSLKCVPKGPINNIPALVQIMAWHRPGNKPLSWPTQYVENVNTRQAISWSTTNILSTEL